MSLTFFNLSSSYIKILRFSAGHFIELFLLSSSRVGSNYGHCYRSWQMSAFLITSTECGCQILSLNLASNFSTFSTFWNLNRPRVLTSITFVSNYFSNWDLVKSLWAGLLDFQDSFRLLVNFVDQMPRNRILYIIQNTLTHLMILLALWMAGVSDIFNLSNEKVRNSIET
mgnify:FL=1